jgi:hypothetical protein
MEAVMRFAELAEILRRELGSELASKACRVLCQQAAGESVYIPTRAAAPEILPTDTPKRVADRYGVPRSTAANWVNRWRG